MPQHITVNHTIHEMSAHEVSTVSFQNSQIIDVYDVNNYTGARLVGQINDGTDYERIIFEIGHNGTNVGYDETRILIKGSLISMNFSMSVADSKVKLTITMVGSNTFNFKYFVTPSGL